MFQQTQKNNQIKQEIFQNPDKIKLRLDLEKERERERSMRKNSNTLLGDCQHKK